MVQKRENGPCNQFTLLLGEGIVLGRLAKIDGPEEARPGESRYVRMDPQCSRIWGRDGWAFVGPWGRAL
jgi:hypothetical protein